MKRPLAVLAATFAMMASGGPTSAQVSQPEEFCTGSLTGTVLCQTVGVNYLPEGIDTYPCDANGHAPSGALDQTANLQDWINSVPDGYFANGIAAFQVVVFPADRCIRMDGQLTVHDRHYLIFDGNDVTIDQHLMPATIGFQGSGGWDVLRGTYLQWRSFKIVGNHTEKKMSLGLPTKVSEYGSCHDGLGTCEFQYGWEFSGSRHVRLDGNETRNTHGDSIAIGWDLPNQPPNATDARFITINNHKILGAGRQGISGVSGRDITISNSYIEGAAQVGIDIEQAQPLFPVRKWTITHNDFGQSFAALAQLGVADCTEVSDITFSHNEQVEPNITVWPAVLGNSAGGWCSAQRGPLTITHNKFWVERWGWDPDVAAHFTGYSNVTYSKNWVKHSCHSGTPGCSAYRTAVELEGGSGHMLNNNNLAVPGGQAWSSVYEYDGVVHGSLGSNVNSCGNTTAQGADQPNPCFPPLP